MKTNNSKKAPAKIVTPSSEEQRRRQALERTIAATQYARSLRFDNRAFHIELVSGYEVTIPIEKLEELKGATRRQLAAVRIAPDGSALEQRELDVDISMPGLLREVTGQSAIQRLAGAAKSPAKAAAARSNGAKDGRPKEASKELTA